MRRSAGFELHSLRLIGLGQHGHGAGAGVDAALGFSGGHTLHAVAARFEFELPVDVVAFDAQHHFLVAAQVALVGRHHLHRPALALGVAGVHAGQIAREQGGFITARASADLQEGVASVVRVLGQQGGLQLRLQLCEVGLGLGDFFLGHGAHVKIVRDVMQHLAGRDHIVGALGMAASHVAHAAHLGMLLREAAVALGVGGHLRVGQRGVQLVQSVRKAIERSSQEGGQARAHPWPSSSACLPGLVPLG